MEFLAGSLLELITQTSTNLPPDVRAAMSLAAAGTETPGHAILAGARHHSVEYRHGERRRRPHLPGHRHADVRRAHARRRQPDARFKRAIRDGRRRSHAARQAAAQFGGFAHRQKQRQQPGRRDAGDPLRAVGRGRDRSEADPQRRRLREQEHPVFRALQTGPSGPRRPQSGRRAQMHSARRVAGAGPGLRAGRAGRVHRQRSRAWLRAGQGPIVPHARRCESQSGAGEARSRDHGRGQPAGRRRHGLRRQGFADRLQDHRGEPAAGEFLRLGGVRLLGVPPPGRAARCRRRRDHRMAVSRSGPPGRAHGARPKASR